MLNCEELEFSLMGVSLAASQMSISRHGNRCCCYSAIQCPICPKLHMVGKSHGLKTSKYEYFIIIRALPAGNRKLLLYTILNMRCPICTKLHTFDKNIGLKISKCQCSVKDIAPPAGNSKLLLLN